MFSVRLAPRALVDLRRLPAFLAPQSPQAAEHSRDKLLEGLESLRHFPNRGHEAQRKGLRELVIGFGRGAYVFRYQVRGNDVLVVSIRHSRERR